jgi:hypothetical protein
VARKFPIAWVGIGKVFRYWRDFEEEGAKPKKRWGGPLVWGNFLLTKSGFVVEECATQTATVD